MALSRTAGLALGLAVLGGVGLIVFEATQKGPRPGTAPLPPGGTGPTPPPFIPPVGAPPPPCIPVTLSATGPGAVSGCGGSTRSATQVCPAPGEQCVFTAWPDPGAAFAQWTGPGGITSRANPLTLPVTSAGFLQATFTGSGPAPTPAGLPPCPTARGTAISNGQAGSKVYVVDHLGRKHWITNGAAWLWCAYGGKQTTTCNVDAVPTGSDIGFGASCCPGEGNPPPGCTVY